MRVSGSPEGALEQKAKKRLSSLPTLVAFLLWISPGLGQDKPSSSPRLQDLSLCSSACSYVWSKCEGNQNCALELCPYLSPVCNHQPGCPLLSFECWNLLSNCPESFFYNDNKLETKRSILNKNVAYLLLKLHPFLNQTSQYGFLTSARFRRIGGNYGTEFLGKRSNKSKGREPVKVKPTQKPTFYSLPLDKFSKAKILKRSFMQELEKFRQKRIGGGRVILGSEFLGKRGVENTNNLKSDVEGKEKRLVGNELLGKRTEERYFDGKQQPEEGLVYGRTKRLIGNEFLGKRHQDEYSEWLQPFGDVDEKTKRLLGNEFLGKRALLEYFDEFPPPSRRMSGFTLNGNEFLGKRDKDNSVGGTELLGKKNTRNEFLGKKNTRNEFLGKRNIGNELLGRKRSGNELLGKKSEGFQREMTGIWNDYDPELIDEAFSNYKPPEQDKTPELCDENCRRTKKPTDEPIND